MTAVTNPTIVPRPTVRVPSKSVGTGIAPLPGVRIMLRAADRFAARWSDSDEVGLCCEVLRKHGSKYECLILNGAWGLTFNEQGVAKLRGRTAGIVLLLPKKFMNVANMDDWDRVLTVVEQQLRKAAPKKKPAAAQST